MKFIPKYASGTGSEDIIDQPQSVAQPQSRLCGFYSETCKLSITKQETFGKYNNRGLKILKKNTKLYQADRPPSSLLLNSTVLSRRPGGRLLLHPDRCLLRSTFVRVSASKYRSIPLMVAGRSSTERNTG